MMLRPTSNQQLAPRPVSWTLALMGMLIAGSCVTGCGKKATDGATEAGKSGAQGAGAANAGTAAEPPKPPTPIDRSMLGAFKPLPKNFDSQTNPPSEPKLRLGHKLYFETRLSRSGTISCNSCHNLKTAGVDLQPTSPGHAGKLGDRNSPTVFNAAGHFRQFWDGREPDVEAQAKGPVLNAVEHGLKDAAEVEAILKAIPAYVALFERAFPQAGKNAVTFDNFAKAVGAFERKLVTPAAWDRFLEGDDGALSTEQKIGARLFVEVGCLSCHNGPLLGGTTYQKLGKVRAWPKLTDEGRKKETGMAADLHHFKVPSLRNVARTMPYFHDGTTADLGEAVKLMARHQLGRDLSDAEVSLLVGFLDCLTGEPPAEWTETPELPAQIEAKPSAAAVIPAVRTPPAAVEIAPRQPDSVPHAPPGPGSSPPPPLPPADHVPPPPEK